MILVTGGNGYVGRALCLHLAGAGLEPLSASRKVYDTPEYPSVIADVTDMASLEYVFDAYEVDVVVHLASMLNTASRRYPDRAVRVNVVGSLNLMEICRDREVRRFVFGSSINAIGSRPGSSNPVDETEPSLPDEFYGETKRFIERLGISLSEMGAFEFVSARMPIVVGPGEPSSTSAWRSDMFNLLRSGGYVKIGFGGEEVIPLAHYDEVARSIAVLATTSTLTHPIYHLPDESWRVSDLARELESIGNGLKVTWSERALFGIPSVISWDRLRLEFGYEAIPLRDRLVCYKEVTD